MPRRTLGFFAGIAYLGRGARFVYSEHRALARFWLAPIGLNACLLGAGGYFALHDRARIARVIWAAPEASGVTLGLHHAFEWLIALLSLAVVVVVVALVASVVAAPFNDALSEAVERIAYGERARGFRLLRIARDVVRSLALELAKLGLYAAAMLSLFLLNLALPGVYAPVYALAGPCLTGFFLAIDYMDWAASRRELAVRERFGFAFTHLRPVLGFGLAVELLLFVPLVNLLFMPAAVAGATLLFLELRARDGSG